MYKCSAKTFSVNVITVALFVVFPQLCLVLTLCAAFWVRFLNQMFDAGVSVENLLNVIFISFYFVSLQWQKKGLAIIFCIMQFLAMTW